MDTIHISHWISKAVIFKENRNELKAQGKGEEGTSFEVEGGRWGFLLGSTSKYVLLFPFMIGKYANLKLYRETWVALSAK